MSFPGNKLPPWQWNPIYSQCNRTTTRMTVFEHVCMHSFSCQQYHMPFKRKNKSIESEWPDIAISGEISCSSRDDSIAFSYITSGSKCTSFHTTLSSLTKLINSKSINFHTPKVSVEVLEILICSCKKAIENSPNMPNSNNRKAI